MIQTVKPKTIPSNDTIIIGDLTLKADENDRQRNKKIFNLLQMLMNIDQLSPCSPVFIGLPRHTPLKHA